MRIFKIHSSLPSLASASVPSQPKPPCPNRTTSVSTHPFPSNFYFIPTKDRQRQSPSHGITILRRETITMLFPCVLLFPFLYHPLPSFAFDIGFSGPKDWLKEQKKKSAKFLLAPIDASRDILRSAYLLLTMKDSDYEDKDLEAVQRILRSAARDCIPGERNAFVSFQAKSGVEVCTFTLILNNASSLLDDKDPAKLEAEALLTNLLRSFSLLNRIASEANIQVVSNRQQLADGVMETVSSLDKFEQGVNDCLEG